ncbi:6-hydroxy-3-succinoylpyridine 3-monooxygenase HspB [Aspergillus lentulus]|nr:6-hydroxy-3-succinoylpyridine 3-monooxygenase HspB [Aspergillus lentulus]
MLSVVENEENSYSTTVVIIGAGPVGLLTALRLAQSGIKVDIVEKEADLSDAPRACSYYAAALHALQKANVLDDIKTAGFTTGGLCWRGPLDDDGKGGKKLGEMLACLPIVGTNDWDHGVVNLQQSKLASLLYRRAVETGLVKVHFGLRLKGIQQDADSVTATVSREDGSTETTFHASFLVGADGGRSTTRKLLGIQFKGHIWPERLVAIDVLIKDAEFDDDFPSSLFVDPVHWGLVSPLEKPQRGKETLWRCTVALHPSDQRGDDQVVAEESIRSLLSHVVPSPQLDTAAVVRASPYRVHQLCATTLNSGRCVLVGDAAHLNNPMGAMGLTTGILDADALADALELIIHEGKPISVLDVYSDERRRAFQMFVDPSSSQNKLRIASDVSTAKQDWLIRFMARASGDGAMVKQATEPFFSVWRTDMRKSLYTQQAD